MRQIFRMTSSGSSSPLGSTPADGLTSSTRRLRTTRTVTEGSAERVGSCEVAVPLLDDSKDEEALNVVGRGAGAEVAGLVDLGDRIVRTLPAVERKRPMLLPSLTMLPEADERKELYNLYERIAVSL